MSENKLEIVMVADQFREEDVHTYGGVYEKYGLMGDGTILAHCVHLDEQEREVIRRTGAGVSHCPSSNLFLSSGNARIRDLLALGIKVSYVCEYVGLAEAGSRADQAGWTGHRLFWRPAHVDPQHDARRQQRLAHHQLY